MREPGAPWLCHIGVALQVWSAAPGLPPASPKLWILAFSEHDPGPLPVKMSFISLFFPGYLTIVSAVQEQAFSLLQSSRQVRVQRMVSDSQMQRRARAVSEDRSKCGYLLVSNEHLNLPSGSPLMQGLSYPLLFVLWRWSGF